MTILIILLSLFIVLPASAQPLPGCPPACVGTTVQGSDVGPQGQQLGGPDVPSGGGGGGLSFSGTLGTLGSFAGFLGGGGPLPVIDQQNLTQNIAQLLRLVQQLADMLKNSKAGAMPWTSQLERLIFLGRSLQYGQGLSYALHDVDTQFTARYPGYKPPEDWNAQYGTWMQTAMDTLRGGLAALQIFPDNIAWDVTRIAEIASAATGAPGRMAAIQAGISASLEAVGQLQRLQQIQAQHTSMYAVIEGAKLNDQAARDAKARAYFENGWRDRLPMHGDCYKPCVGKFGIPAQIIQR